MSSVRYILYVIVMAILIATMQTAMSTKKDTEEIIRKTNTIEKKLYWIDIQCVQDF